MVAADMGEVYLPNDTAPRCLVSQSLPIESSNEKNQASDSQSSLTRVSLNKCSFETF